MALSSQPHGREAKTRLSHSLPSVAVARFAGAREERATQDFERLGSPRPVLLFRALRARLLGVCAPLPRHRAPARAHGARGEAAGRVLSRPRRSATTRFPWQTRQRGALCSGLARWGWWPASSPLLSAHFHRSRMDCGPSTRPLDCMTLRRGHCRCPRCASHSRGPVRM